MENEKMYFWQIPPKASFFMTETLIVQKVAYILASFSEGEWFSYLFSVLRKISYKLEKMEKNSEKFFINLLAKKIQSETILDITFSLKRSLHKPRKINEAMNPISVMRYTSSSKREPRNFFKKMKYFWQKKTKASYLMTVLLLVQKEAYIYAVLLKRERFLYLLSVLRNMSYE